MLQMLHGDLGNLIKSGAKLPDNIKVVDAAMNAKAGVKCHKYDGCIKCNKHVWDETDKGGICPICQGNRYDAKEKPLEQVVHFPIRERLEALTRDSLAFQEAVHYEKTRRVVKDGVMAGEFFV